MRIPEIEKRAIIARYLEKIKPKFKEVIGRKYKELLDENKALKEENERLKELVKNMQDDIQLARQSGYELGMHDGRNRIF